MTKKEKKLLKIINKHYSKIRLEYWIKSLNL